MNGKVSADRELSAAAHQLATRRHLREVRAEPLRDPGSSIAGAFGAVIQTDGTTILRIAVQALYMNAASERRIGTLRGEFPDRVPRL